MVIKREKEEGKKKKKGRKPCCMREEVRRGAWTADEDKILVDFITKNGHETWRNLPKLAGLHRCGKSCRLRWTNYLRPDIRRGPFTSEEENMIIRLQEELGNKWAAIASHLEGRTDNDVKNFWNSHLRKRFNSKVLNHPSSSTKSIDTKPGSSTCHVVQWESMRLEAESHLSNTENKTNGDYFLHMWNSKVGESFRSINECGGAASYSPISQSSSSTRAESTSLAEPCKASKSYEIDDSDAMLKLLLDFPVSGNDMAFLEAHLHDAST